MDKFFIPLNLMDRPEVDKVTNKNKIINAKKHINDIIKKSRNRSKLKNCYYCKKECNSFCNSHTIPAFCLKNIAVNGKVYYSNTIIDLPIINDEKGVNEAGTFHLICRECDSKIFQDYENPDNYSEIPSIKMLAQMDMKNNLKHIDKKLLELEMYEIMGIEFGFQEGFTDRKYVSKLDLKEFNDSFNRARKSSLKPFDGDYYIGCYEKVPYTVPIAFQGTIALISDMDGEIINDIYNQNPKYVIRNISICVLPLKGFSIVMLFVDKKNKRYSHFFKQLKKMNLNDKLSVINYIIFAYSEDYFFSPQISNDVINKLELLSGKTTELLSLQPTNKDEQIKAIQEVYNYDDRYKVPNLLSEQYRIND